MDAAGNAYVTGWTESSNFPTINPLQPKFSNGSVTNGFPGGGAFVAKLNPTGADLVYSTCLGCNGNDAGLGIAVDAFGSAYIVGFTGSPDFPTVNPLQPFGGQYDAFVAKLLTVYALWVWEGQPDKDPKVEPFTTTSETARESLVERSSISGVNVLYFDPRMSTTPSGDIASLITQAHKKGIQVWNAYSPGWKKEDGSTLNCTDATASMDGVIAYNAANPTAKFDGVALDIEPTEPADFEALLTLYGCILPRLKTADLRAATTIRFFWDMNVTSDGMLCIPDPGVPSCKEAYKHIIDMDWDNVVVMGYRDRAGTSCSGTDMDGIICMDEAEIDYADSLKKYNLILAGLETSNCAPGCGPDKVTFFEEGQEALNLETKKVAEHFGGRFGGFAIDYYKGSYLSGLPGWPNAKSITQEVSEDGTVTTDTVPPGATDPDGATVADPVETSITTPNAGTISIKEVAVTQTSPSGFELLGQQIQITAPPTIDTDPLVIVFQIDDSLIPSGETVNTIQIFKNGVLVPNCTIMPSTIASPDPCVSIRELLADDAIPDVKITVLTSSASAWNFGMRAFTRVAIDIKPGSFPNSINLGSAGTVPVAIFSTPTFNAVTVDPMTVTLASAPVDLKGKGTPMASFEDINGDGLLDLVVHVSTTALQLRETDTEAILKGKTFDGTAIRGTDSVRVVP